MSDDSKSDVAPAAAATGAPAETDASATPAPEAKADDTFGHLKANEPQKIYILKGNQTALVGAENYLRKRGWTVETSTNLKLALIQIIQMRPDFVFISADNPHPKARIIPKVLVQVFPCFVIGFAESATRSSINNLELMGTQNTMVPPISGPKIERIVNKIIIELHSKPPEQRLKMAQGAAGAGGNTIAIKGGQAESESSSTGGSSSDQARAAIQAMLAGGDDDSDSSDKSNSGGMDPNFGAGSGAAAASGATMMKGAATSGGPAYSGSAAGSASGAAMGGAGNTFGQPGQGGSASGGRQQGAAYNGQTGQGGNAAGGFGQGGQGRSGSGGFGHGGAGGTGAGGFGQGGQGRSGSGGFGHGGAGGNGAGGFGQGGHGENGTGGFGQGAQGGMAGRSARGPNSGNGQGQNSNSDSGFGPLGQLGHQGYQEPLVPDDMGRLDDPDSTGANGMGMKSQTGRGATAGLQPHDELPETPGEAKYWDEISKKANHKKGAKPAPDANDFADAFDEVGVGRAPLKARPRNDENRAQHGARLQDWVKRRETNMQRRPKARDGKDIIITGNQSGDGENFKSMMDEGTYRTLQETVVIEAEDGKTEIVKLAKSSNIACIVVESPKFSGYLVAAMGGDRQIDREFMDTVRTKLKSFLKERGEEISEKETLDLSLQEVEFSDWALEQAEFLRKSVHKGDEIAMAFFPADTTQKELENSKKEHMLMIEMDELKPDTAVEFDLYVYLPENDKYILYTPKGRKLGGAQKSRLSEKGVSQMHLRKESQSDVKRYRVQNFLNDKIANYKLKKQVAT